MMAQHSYSGVRLGHIPTWLYLPSNRGEVRFVGALRRNILFRVERPLCDIPRNFLLLLYLTDSLVLRLCKEWIVFWVILGIPVDTKLTVTANLPKSEPRSVTFLTQLREALKHKHECAAVDCKSYAIERQFPRRARKDQQFDVPKRIGDQRDLGRSSTNSEENATSLPRSSCKSMTVGEKLLWDLQFQHSRVENWNSSQCKRN